jgi:hypothetical protein
MKTALYALGVNLMRAADEAIHLAFVGLFFGAGLALGASTVLALIL